MIKYNTKLLTDALLFKAVSKWLKKGWIQADAVQGLNTNTHSYYAQSSWLKRAGMFIATFLSVWGIIGFFSLFLFQLADSNFGFVGFLSLLFGAGLLFYLEKMIDERDWYKQGTDDALLFMGICAIISGTLVMVKPDFNPTSFLAGSLLLLIIMAIVSYRYLNWFYAVVVVLLVNSVPLQVLAMINQQLLFFAALALIPINSIVLKLVNKYDYFENHYFSNCFKFIKYTACIVMYISVNLYVIKETAFNLMGVSEIPLQGLFLTFTITLPLLFIALGLYYKQKYLLHSGLFLLLPTIATVRFYYAVMPIELALTFGGLVLIIVSYFAIKRIQKNDTPFTFEADGDEDLSNAELLLTVQQFGSKNTNIANDKTFGGGTFGGAGAEGKF